MADTPNATTTEALDYETIADNYTKARAKRQRLERRATEAKVEETMAQSQLLEWAKNNANGSTDNT